MLHIAPKFTIIIQLVSCLFSTLQCALSMHDPSAGGSASLISMLASFVLSMPSLDTVFKEIVAI